MKYILVLLIVIVTSCSLFKPTIIEKEKTVYVNKECVCDTVSGEWHDTTYLLIPCDSGYIIQKGDHTDTEIKGQNGWVKGRVITKQAKPKIIIVKRDSFVYKVVVESCEKKHIKEWHVWVFFISLLLNIAGVLFLIKKYVG